MEEGRAAAEGGVKRLGGAQGKPRVFRGRALAQIAFPLGGIGAGNVSVGGRGQLLDWEIFNRPAKGLVLQHSQFMLWAKPAGKDAVAAVLESEPGPPFPGSYGYAPGTAAGLPRFRQASFSAAYPFARVGLADPAMPVQARLEAFSPFAPMRDLESGLPAAVFLWTVTNPGRRRVEASLAFSLLNPVGLEGTETLVGAAHAAFGGNVNELVHEGHGWGVKMTSGRYGPQDVRHGSLAALALWPRVSAVTRWPKPGGWGLWDPYAVWREFAETGRVRGPSDAVASPPGRSEHATLAALLELEPGESLTVPFILAWHFPNRVNDWNTEADVRGKIVRNYYATWFADAWAVARYASQEFDRLAAVSRSFESALYGSTLPAEVIESAGNQLVTLRSPSCFRDEEGRFFGFEGCGRGYEGGNDRTGCCPLNCTHVWNYAQTAAHLFPELERSMRETDFLANTRPGGDMAFRTMIPLSARVLWSHRPAADGQMGTVMRLYREWRVSGDREFLARLWPKAAEAVEFAWKAWDFDRDGVMEGEQHNTYDIEFYGPNPLTTLLYLGALRAAEEMALALGEADRAREYRRVFESGSRKAAELLWNGEYYAQPGAPADRVHQHGTGCLTDQLLGQWLAHELGLGYLVPEAQARRAAAAVFKHNFREALRTVPNTGRVYALQDEAGVVMCTWPRGERPAAPFPYADEVWTGSEYALAALLVYEGHQAQAMRIVRAVRARHDGERRNPFNEPECGNHYVRGLSSWSLLLALSGASWSAPDAALRIVPPEAGRRFSCLYTAGTAWGVAELGRSARRALATFRVEDGSVRLRRLRLPQAFARLERGWIEPGTTFVKGTAERRGGETQVEFPEPVELKGGQALVLSFLSIK